MEKDKTTCASRIKVALAIRGMRQVDLVEKTGIGKSAISQYCSGTYVPKQDATYLIASALGVSVPWLMGYDVPMEQAKAESTTTLTKEEAELFELLSELDAIDKASIMGEVRGTVRQMLKGEKYKKRKKENA